MTTTTLDPFGGRDTTSTSTASSSRRAACTPVIFCGPGSALYPLCDPSSSTSTSAAVSLIETLPKALLPVANRPLIAYPLQQIVSAGLRHAIVLAPANQHRAIEIALKAIKLQVPHVADGKSSTTSSSAKAAAQSSNAVPEESNIVVVDGLSTSAAAKGNEAALAAAAIKVELLPLGPYDTLGGKAVDMDMEDHDEDTADPRTSRSRDAPEFRPLARPGTAELLRWVSSIGKLESDPLVLPVDFVAPSLTLSSFLLSYYSSCSPSPPTVTTLLYQRGAGESVGRDREKEGPSRLVAAYSHAHPSHLTHNRRPDDPSLSTHSLLMLQEPPTAGNIEVRLSLLRAHPRTVFSTNLLDSHIYLFRRDQIVPLLNTRRDMTSLREHVVPFVAKATWQTGLAEKAGWIQAMAEEEAQRKRMQGEDEGEEAMGASNQDIAGSEGLMKLAFQRSSLGLPSTSKAATAISSSALRAVTIVARLPSSDSTASTTEAPAPKAKGHDPKKQKEQEPEEKFFARANTLATYLECNRYLLRSLSAAGQSGTSISFALPAIIYGNGNSSTSTGGIAASASTTISPSAQLSADTLLPLPDAPSSSSLVTISDRVSLKRSVVSPNVSISRGARISGCVLLEGCHVGENARLDNCILGPGSRVGDKCTLKDVDLGPGARVQGGSEQKNEKVVRGEQDDEDGSGAEQDEEK